MAVEYIQARELLLSHAKPVRTERVPLEECLGRVLAVDLSAKENVPPFDRSPYDGYALRSADTACAGPDKPVTLNITEEIPAGRTPTRPVLPGTAAKVLTGAPIPEGADAVIMFERTVFTRETVTITASLSVGENIIRAGEDVKAGQVLASAGSVIDAGLLGTLAAQGEAAPLVYAAPRVGLICTGSEVLELGETAVPGKIYNTNRYTIGASLRREGCAFAYYGIAGDTVEAIANKLEQALAECDAVLLTGGVSVGDYDLTPAAMETVGVELLVRGVAIKPGMACAYGVRQGKLVCGLSGNPASSVTNLYAVVMPALRRLCGRKDALPEEITLTLADDFGKKSKDTRFLRGRLDATDGTARMRLSQDQGNVVISSMIGSNVFAVVPAGSGKLKAGTVLKGFCV